MPRRATVQYVDPQAPHGLFRRMVLRLLSTRTMGALERSVVFRVIVWRLAPRLMRLTRGQLRHAIPVPTGIIETRDARNGRPHRRMVVYFHDGERVTVIPSKAGLPEDPFWYQNAVADPAVLFGGRPFCAEVVEDSASQVRIWRLADRFFPSYVGYRERAARSGRTIPILQLVPC
jgi:deazaflavin-dependent oxidoreductase (nitroreductase family)